MQNLELMLILRGLTKAGLAEALNASESTIERWCREDDVRPQRSLRETLEEVMGVSYRTLTEPRLAEWLFDAARRIDRRGAP